MGSQLDFFLDFSLYLGDEAWSSPFDHELGGDALLSIFVGHRAEISSCQGISLDRSLSTSCLPGSATAGSLCRHLPTVFSRPGLIQWWT